MTHRIQVDQSNSRLLSSLKSIATGHRRSGRLSRVFRWYCLGLSWLCGCVSEWTRSKSSQTRKQTVRVKLYTSKQKFNRFSRQSHQDVFQSGTHKASLCNISRVASCVPPTPQLWLVWSEVGYLLWIAFCYFSYCHAALILLKACMIFGTLGVRCCLLSSGVWYTLVFSHLSGSRLLFGPSCVLLL